MTNRKWFRTTIDLIDAFGDRMADGQYSRAERLRDALIRHLLASRQAVRSLCVEAGKDV